MELDHIAVAGETLEEAAAAVEETLGVHLVPGGRHALFGTHNRLLGLDDGLYIEAIAIDPEAGAPDRPRWFDLDRFAGPPRLSNWICRSGDLDATLDVLPTAAGRPVSVSRGDLRWRMGVPADGRLPYDNLLPAQIQWLGALHPCQVLPSSGCRLRRLVVMHPAAPELSALLRPLLADPRVVYDIGPPGLTAEIDTPGGRRELFP